MSAVIGSPDQGSVRLFASRQNLLFCALFLRRRARRGHLFILIFAISFVVRILSLPGLLADIARPIVVAGIRCARSLAALGCCGNGHQYSPIRKSCIARGFRPDKRELMAKNEICQFQNARNRIICVYCCIVDHRLVFGPRPRRHLFVNFWAAVKSSWGQFLSSGIET